MKLMRSIRRLRLPEIFLAVLVCAPMAAAQDKSYPDYPSEMPAQLQPTNYGFDYTKRDVMIPMRDGVKLHTVILVPKGAKNAPILLTRTPYDATGNVNRMQSSHLGPILE